MTSTRDILERNDLVYKTLPPRWVFGLPIGNGQVGGMIWVEDDTKVVVTLDSVWAWDLRQTPKQATYAHFRELMAAEKYEEIGAYLNTGEPLPRKTYVGRLVIDVERKISGEGRLRLHNAEVELDLRTGDGDAIHLKFVAYANLPAIAVDHPQTGIKEIRLERLSTERVGLHGAPEYTQGTSASIEWIRQDIPESPQLCSGCTVERHNPSRQSKLREKGATRLKKPSAYLRRHRQPPTSTSKTIALGGEAFGKNQASKFRTKRLNRSGIWGCTCSRAQAARADVQPASTGSGRLIIASRPHTVSTSGTSTRNIGDFTRQTIWNLASPSVTIFSRFSRASRNRPGSSTSGMAFLSPAS